MQNFKGRSFVKESFANKTRNYDVFNVLKVYIKINIRSRKKIKVYKFKNFGGKKQKKDKKKYINFKILVETDC